MFGCCLFLVERGYNDDGENNWLDIVVWRGFGY